MARSKGKKLGLLDKLTQIVRARAEVHPISANMLIQSHQLRREHAESMGSHYIALKLKQDALEAYHRSSGKPVIQITPELACVIAERLMPAEELTKEDFELMVQSGYPSLSAAARAHGIDRRTLQKNLDKYGIKNPWKRR